VSDGEEEKWERPSFVVPMHRIRQASPRGTTATGGARSPSCHHTRCRMRASDQLSGMCN
jgi:hypothetical protein